MPLCGIDLLLIEDWFPLIWQSHKRIQPTPPGGVQRPGVAGAGVVGLKGLMPVLTTNQSSINRRPTLLKSYIKGLVNGSAIKAYSHTKILNQPQPRLRRG
jgi:hypothetical protein